MANSVYQINKGINKPIEFRGLKAQYIWYLGAAAMGLLVIYAVMYILGINTYISIVVILILGALMVMQIYAMSNKYGEHGLTKVLARKSIPKIVKLNSRKVFRELKKEEHGKKIG